MRNSGMSGGYSQQGYQSRPPTNWASPAQQPGYGYAPPQYNMNQPPYSGYPQPTSWDPSTAAQNQQTGGYDYYNQQQTQAGSGAPAPAPTDSSGYNYSQSQAYSQGQGYSQDGYGGYQAQPNPSSGYDQQQQQGYGNVSNPTPDAHTTSYESNQAQAYNSGYGSYGPPQTQKPQNGQPAYAQSPTAQGGGYTQAGYGAQSYGAQPPAQPSYGQQQAPAYNTYGGGGGYSQPQAYSSDATQSAPPTGAASKE